MFMAIVLEFTLSLPASNRNVASEQRACSTSAWTKSRHSFRYVTLRYVTFLAVGFVSRSSCSPAQPQLLLPLTTRHATTTTRSLALVLQSRVCSWQHVAATCQPSDLTFGNCLNCCSAMQPINRQTEQSTCLWECDCVRVWLCCVWVCLCVIYCKQS